MVAGGASERSLGSPSRRSVAGWSSPIKLSGLSPDEGPRKVSKLGQDTADVLSRIGIEETELQSLRRDGVI